MATIASSGTEGIVVDGSSVPAPQPNDISVAEREVTGDLLLISNRKMYDQGTVLTFCPSLNGLAQGAVAAINPQTLSELGVAAGSDVTVSNGNGSITLPSVAHGGVAPGCVAIDFNQPNASVTELLDASRSVTSVRVEASA